MIAAIVDGGNTTGLMLYLVGPGRANEHSAPHLVAGDGVLLDRWGEWESLSSSQGVEIAHALDRYMTAFGVHPVGDRRVWDDEQKKRVIVGNRTNHVWHCSLSLSPEEPALDADTWRKIATDFMDAMGFTGADGKAPCRWVAVHHGTSKNGGDHIHIVANVVRGDGTRWSKFRDQVKASRACNTLEHRYGLRIVEGREHGRGARADSARDLRASARRGQAETDRARLETRVRAAALAAGDEADFVARVRAMGVRIRPRFAKGRTDVVEGYSVAMHTRAGERPQWYGGGRLARDLTLTRLRTRWADTPDGAQRAVDAWRAAHRGAPLTASGGLLDRVSFQATATALNELRATMSRIDPTDPVALADATRDVAGAMGALGLLHAGSDLGDQLQRAGRAVGRCAQTHTRPHWRYPAPNALVAAARMASVAATDHEADSVLLVVEVMELARTLAELHDAARQAQTARDMLRDTVAAFKAIHQVHVVDPVTRAAVNHLGARGWPTRPGDTNNPWLASTPARSAPAATTRTPPAQAALAEGASAAPPGTRLATPEDGLSAQQAKQVARARAMMAMAAPGLVPPDATPPGHRAPHQADARRPADPSLEEAAGLSAEQVERIRFMVDLAAPARPEHATPAPGDQEEPPPPTPGPVHAASRAL